MNFSNLQVIPPDTEQIGVNELANLFKALGHPVRIKIIKHLLQEDSCVCGRIVEVFPLAQSTVSQHLKILKDTGLIHGEVEGPKTCYCVNKTKLVLISTSMSALLNCEDV
jgi:ArsR family transcriptional regulator